MQGPPTQKFLEFKELALVFHDTFFSVNILSETRIFMFASPNHRWELKTEDQLKSKSYIGFFHNLSDDFTGDSVQLLTGKSFAIRRLIQGYDSTLTR